LANFIFLENLYGKYFSRLYKSALISYYLKLTKRGAMSKYDLKSLNLPKLTGTALKLFAAAVENPALRGALMPGLLKNGGIPDLGQITLEEVPTIYPFVEPQDHIHPQGFKADKEGKPRNFPFRTITDYANAYRKGETTPLEVAEKVLAAIEDSKNSTPDLKLFIAVYREDVLKQAKASTERFARHKPIGLLEGVPIAVKDEVDMLPYPTTVGTRFMGKEAAKQDSTVVARLRDAGVLLVGKTNMHEIGINPNGYNDTYGAVRNPYDPDCDPGGSSSGSAATVAAGIVPAAIGADGGGSIRIPASLCGLVGLKSTFGRISEFGAAPLCWSMGHLGPLSVSVEDTALVYSVIAGVDAKDKNTVRQPAVTLKDWNKGDLNGIKAGIYQEWFEYADPEVVKVNYELIEKLKIRGLIVKEIEIPELNATRIAHAITILSEMAICLKKFAAQRQQHGAAVRLSLVIGEVLTAMDYLQAQRMRTRAMDHFNAIFSGVDVILTPATAKASQPILPGGLNGGWSDLSLDTEMMRFIIPGNLLGLPAISFPSGYDSRGMPIGMQAIGRHWEESVLLRTAYNAEQIVERKLPKMYFG
jgi:Asp-tRNA(Asn)/Glu-tRNA(Gln) amidotransferase A subunit family amidase